MQCVFRSPGRPDVFVFVQVSARGVQGVRRSDNAAKRTLRRLQQQHVRFHREPAATHCATVLQKDLPLPECAQFSEEVG